MHPKNILSSIHGAFRKNSILSRTLRLLGKRLSHQGTVMLEEQEAFLQYDAWRRDEIEEKFIITPFASIQWSARDVFSYYLPCFLISAIAPPIEITCECLMTRFVRKSYGSGGFTPAAIDCNSRGLSYHLQKGITVLVMGV